MHLNEGWSCMYAYSSQGGVDPLASGLSISCRKWLGSLAGCRVGLCLCKGPNGAGEPPGLVLMLTGGGSGGRGIAIYYSMHETFAKHVFWSWRCQRPSWLLGKLHPSNFFQCRTHTCVNLQLEPNLWIRLLGWVAWGSCRQVAHFCIGWMDGWHSGAAMQDEDDPHPVADQTLL